MAVKYRIEFTSQVFRLPYRLDIYDNNYTGAPLVLKGANPPVAKRRDNDGIFFGTSLDIGIEVPVSMPWGITDLYSQTARDHKVELYKNGVLDWCGYLVPEEYSDPLIAPPFDIFLRAVDGIGTLKNFDFSIDINGEMVSQLTIIQHCLSKLDITLPLAICMNIWEDNHTTTRSAIEQTYMSPSAFYDADGAPFTCDEVLQLIFNSYDTQIAITQEAGYWLITREIDAPSRSYICYNAAGAYTETKLFNNIVGFGSKTAYTASRCYPINSLSRSFFAQRKQFSISQDYGLNNNAFPYRLVESEYEPYNYNGVGVQLGNKHWFTYGILNEVQPVPLFRNKNGIALKFWGQAFCTPFDVAANGRDLQLVIPLALVSGDMVSEDITVTVKNNDKYLSLAGWTTTQSSVVFTVSPIGDSNAYRLDLTDLTLSMPAIETGTLQVTILRGGFWVVVGELSMAFLSSEDNPIPSGIDADVLINSSAIQSESVECYGDVPNDVNSRLIYHNGFYLSTQMPTHAWKMSGDTESTSLLSVLARSLASNFRTARQVYSGTLQGASLSLCSIIKDAANSNRQFICITASHNLLTDELEGDFRELLPFAEAEMTYSDDPVYSNSSKNNTTTNSSRDYIVFGGSVGVGKRIYQLPLANSTANKYIMIDADGNEEAERTPYVEGMPKTLFDSMFELVPNSGNPYIKAKFDFASVGEITAFAANDGIPSIWDSMPIASASVLGGVKIGSGLTRAADGTISVSAMGSQVLSFDGTYLSISGGNSVSLANISFNQAANYNPSGAWTFAQAVTLSTSGIKFADNAFGGGGDTAGMRLVTKGGEAQTLELYTTNDADDTINFSTPSGNGLTHNGAVIWSANNFTPANYSLATHLHTGIYEPVVTAGTSAQYRRGDKTWQTLNSSVVPESGNLYFTDARARAACAASGTVYDSARLGGAAASLFTRRDINESVTGAWQFDNITIRHDQASYTEHKSLSLDWGTATAWGAGIFQYHTGSSIDYSFKIKNGTSAAYNPAIYINSASKIGLGKVNNSATSHEVQGTLSIGQWTNGTAVIDAYNGNAYYGCNTPTNGMYIDVNGFGHFDNGVYGNLILPNKLGIYKSNPANGCGISLWEGYQVASNDMPNYGLFFGQCSTFGYHGSVGGFATYFTMNNDGGQWGWIFKNQNNSNNVFSISTAGNVRANGSIYATKVDANPAIMVQGAVSMGGMRIQTYDLGLNGQAYMGLGTDMSVGSYEHSLYFPATPSGKMTIGTYDGTTYSTKVRIDSSGLTSFYGVVHSNSSIRGARLTVASTTGSGAGISLYGDSGNDVYTSVGAYSMPSFGVHFSKTAYFGTHGGVTGDWATYFTMDTTAGRGWIFRSSYTLASLDNNGNLVTSGTLTSFTASDERLKTNIKGINGNAMSVIRRLRGVEFDWNETAFHHNSSLRKNPHSASYIAQEWEQVLPWATHSIYGQFKSIDKDILFPYITEGMIELDSEVTQLKRKVAQLEQQVEQLKPRA